MVSCQKGLFVKTDQAALEIIKQMNLIKPFIQYEIDNESVFCSGISPTELELEVFKRLRNVERPKEVIKQ